MNLNQYTEMSMINVYNFKIKSYKKNLEAQVSLYRSPDINKSS